VYFIIFPPPTLTGPQCPTGCPYVALTLELGFVFHHPPPPLPLVHPIYAQFNDRLHGRCHFTLNLRRALKISMMCMYNCTLHMHCVILAHNRMCMYSVHYCTSVHEHPRMCMYSRVIFRNLKLGGIDKCLGGCKHAQSTNLY